MKILNKINCLFGSHEWTSAVAEGIKVTPAQLDAGADGFFDYAKLYCRQCGKVSEISKRYLSSITIDN